MRDDQGENGSVETGMEEATTSHANASKGARPVPDGRSVDRADFARCKKLETRRRPPVRSELRALEC